MKWNISKWTWFSLRSWLYFILSSCNSQIVGNVEIGKIAHLFFQNLNASYLLNKSQSHFRSRRLLRCRWESWLRKWGTSDVNSNNAWIKCFVSFMHNRPQISGRKHCSPAITKIFTWKLASMKVLQLKETLDAIQTWKFSYPISQNFSLTLIT